jgi:GNAT superfamily N-acetyltransferase
MQFFAKLFKTIVYIVKRTRMQFNIREILLEENDAVKKFFVKNLGIINRIVFGLSFEDAQKNAKRERGGTLVAEHNNEIVGTVSMQIKKIKGEPTGFIDALATDKKHRGKGIGKTLVEHSISWLERKGCKSVYATADRYNSPSWNTFIHKDFSVYEIPWQLKDYGLNFLRLWLQEFHFVGFGTFFLKRNTQPKKHTQVREVWHLIGAILGVSIAWWIQALIGGAPLLLFPLFFAVISFSILSHELSQRLVCQKLGLEATFKAWGSGILVNWVFAIIGGFFPAYGSTYVKQIDWYYNPKDRTAIIFAVGPIVSLILAWIFFGAYILASETLIISSARVGYLWNLFSVIFNLLPVQAAGGFVWDGKKILNWNRIVWVLLCAATIILILIDIMF